MADPLENQGREPPNIAALTEQLAETRLLIRNMWVLVADRQREILQVQARYTAQHTAWFWAASQAMYLRHRLNIAFADVAAARENAERTLARFGELRQAIHASGTVVEAYRIHNAQMEQALTDAGVEIPRGQLTMSPPGLPPVDFNSAIIRVLLERLEEYELRGEWPQPMNIEDQRVVHHVRQYTSQIAHLVARVENLGRELIAEQRNSALHAQRAADEHATVGHLQRLLLQDPNARRQQQILLANINGQADEVIESLSQELDDLEAANERQNERIKDFADTVEHLLAEFYTCETQHPTCIKHCVALGSSIESLGIQIDRIQHAAMRLPARLRLEESKIQSASPHEDKQSGPSKRRRDDDSDKDEAIAGPTRKRRTNII